MVKLEDLTRGSRVKGILPSVFVTILDIQWHGPTALELTYKDPFGKPGSEMIYRDHESSLDIEPPGAGKTIMSGLLIKD
jgi:hypothetical protein